MSWLKKLIPVGLIDMRPQKKQEGKLIVLLSFPIILILKFHALHANIINFSFSVFSGAGGCGHDSFPNLHMLL